MIGIQPQDFRRIRAQSLAAAIMDEITDVVPEVDRRVVYDRLAMVLYANGASWTTEEEREKFGFEPRDRLGWTPSERVAAERDRINALQMMVAQSFIQPTGKAQGR